MYLNKKFEKLFPEFQILIDEIKYKNNNFVEKKIEFFKNDKNFSLEFTFQSLFDQGYDILIPMLIGSLIVSIPVWFISYFTVKFLMTSFKRRKI